MMARCFLLVAVLTAGGALARANQQSPQQLASLAVSDPEDYKAVTELLERQKWGALDQVHKNGLLTAEEKQEFASSQAMKDRQNVLSSVRSMMAQRQQWKEQAAKDDRLSHELTEKPQVAQKPVLKKKLASLSSIRQSVTDDRMADSVTDEELAYERSRLLKGKRTHAARSVSWGAMKQRTRSLRMGKHAKEESAAAGNSWGDLMKQFQGGRAAMEVEKEQKQVGGALSTFRWGEEESIARNGPPVERKKADLLMVAEQKLPSMPDEIDMPVDLDNFLNGAQKQESAWPSKKKAASRYLADLHN